MWQLDPLLHNFIDLTLNKKDLRSLIYLAFCMLTWMKWVCNCERHSRCRVRNYGGGGLIIDFGTAVKMYFRLNISGLVFCSLGKTGVYHFRKNRMLLHYI